MGAGNCPHCNKPVKPGDVVCAICGRILPADIGQQPGRTTGTAHNEDVLAGGVILQGKYEIQKLIHTGGMGFIYSATDIRLRRQVVIKQIREPVRSGPHLEKLEKEAINMARLTHPSVAMILDHFTENNRYFLVVEFVQGKTLADIFEERGHNLPETEVSGWMLPVCDAVASIHKQGFVHRDISPDNIMLSDDGRIKLIDFGTLHELSLLAGRKAAREGKFGFTPPEQWQGNPVPQSDVFAIAATIYYLLTGFLPVTDICRSGGTPQPSDYAPDFPPVRTKNPNISEALQSTLQKALQPDPANRFADAQQLHLALAGLPAGSYKQEQPVKPPEPPPKPPEARPGEHPVIGVDRTSLDFGKVAPGSRPSKSFTVRNFGSGRLMASFTPSAPWIVPSRTTIDTTDLWETITVDIDSSLLLLGQQTAGHIDIQSNGGAARVDVKVKVSDRPKSRFKAWMGISLIALIALIIIVSVPLSKLPDAPALSSPANNSYDLDLASINFSWLPSPGATKYRIMVNKHSNSELVKEEEVSQTNYWLVSKLEPDTLYYWSVQASQPRAGNWGGSWLFKTKPTKHVSTATTASPSSQSSNIVFQDDFSNPNSGWVVDKSGDAVMYANGGLTIKCSNPDLMIGAYMETSKSKIYKNFIIEADAHATPVSTDYGVCCIIFKRIDPNNRYTFWIRPSLKAYGLYKLVNKQPTDLIKYTVSSYINGGLANNKLKVKCEDNTITVYCNGLLLDTVTDTSLNEGEIRPGVAVAKPSNSSITPVGEFVFTSFKISTP